MKHHCIMTISSLLNRERSCSITWDGVLSEKYGTVGMYEQSMCKATAMWHQSYHGISNQGFVVDFYREAKIAKDSK